MTGFRYRAIGRNGETLAGRIEAADRAAAIAGLRRDGARPIEVVALAAGQAPPRRASGKARQAAAASIGELAVLLGAGLQLDRALGLAIENVEDRSVAARLGIMLREVREGKPLSQAMAQAADLFPPSAIAMTEAGEANGRLAAALARLAQTQAQEAELRHIVRSAMIYPVALLVIAVGVVLLMLLFVVPQFESMFAAAP